MIVKPLGNESNGTRSVEIRTGEVSYRALLRIIRKIRDAVVMETAYDPMNDNARIIVKYKDVMITVATPFSDYVINCRSPSAAFDEFISQLRNYRVRWWERLI